MICFIWRRSITTRARCALDNLEEALGNAEGSQLAKALRELGRIERSLFMIEWYSSPTLRRRCQAGLNKGEAAHKFKRAIFFHDRGESRNRSFESQAFRASGLNLVVSAIVHWKTVYLDRAVTQLKPARRNSRSAVEAHLAADLGAFQTDGIYTWDSEQHLPEASIRRSGNISTSTLGWARAANAPTGCLNFSSNE